MTTAPPIPATCAHRPTVGGLVAPYVNVRLADGGVDFRSQHDAKTQECFRERLCQVCSKPLTHPIVFLGGPTQLDTLQFVEPPLHPECANYTSHACPMVAGRLEHFATRAPLADGHRGDKCFDPDCDCGGWIPTPGSAEGGRDGAPAHDWYAFFVSDYTCGATREYPDRIAAAVVERADILVIRHVSTPGVGRLWKRLDRCPVDRPTESTSPGDSDGKVNGKAPAMLDTSGGATHPQVKER